ncbi:GAF domain-containing protein, partial [uncultured Bradyrhizobium sp.]|uniref:GAF domain-containing protein n=1 Tax=uncultured Bradyrhizobium sp. TaxID=199684 RepID=UPI003459238F
MSRLQTPTTLRGETTERLFIGSSELAGLSKDFDWASTSIGPPETWPDSLKTAVRIMLTSQQPIWIGWGDDLTFLYNDPYKSIIGGKHPRALGQPTRVVWREIWNDIAPLLTKAMSGSEGTYVEAQLLIMERNGFPEETYYTFSYSPIPDADGLPAGIFCANTDDTQRVISERQLSLLRELASRAAEARSVGEACERSAAAIATDLRDLPFAMIYLIDSQEQVARLAATSGIARDHAGVIPQLALDGSAAWPIAEAQASRDGVLVQNLKPMFGVDFPSGGWRQAPEQAVVLPILAAGDALAGFLIAGLSPVRLYDERYTSFLGLVSAQITAAINNAQAYEDERRRAEVLAEITKRRTAAVQKISGAYNDLGAQDIPNKAALLGELKGGIDKANSYRAKADTAVKQGKADRDADTVKNFFVAMSELSATSQKVWAAVLRNVSAVDPELGRLSTVRILAWNLRDIAGMERSHIASAIAAKAPIPADKLAGIGEVRAQVALAWKLLEINLKSNEHAEVLKGI